MVRASPTSSEWNRGFGVQRLQTWIAAHEGKADCVLAFSHREPAESGVRFTFADRSRP